MLLLTSDEEGFPNVLLEAMAARLPVLATPAGDAPRVVRGSVTGEIVPFDDLEAFAARVVSLAQSASRRAELGIAARRLVESEYGAAGFGERILKAYAGLARSTGRLDVAELAVA